MTYTVSGGTLNPTQPSSTTLSVGPSVPSGLVTQEEKVEQSSNLIAMHNQQLNLGQVTRPHKAQEQNAS